MAVTREVLTIDREYLRLTEIARLTGLSQTHIRQEIQRGNLNAFRVGRAVLVPRDAIDRWIRGVDHTKRAAA